MKSDISRNTFKAEKHYSAVRLQQGRVQLDADFNEQTDILNEQELTANRDQIGSDGVPLEGGGFKLDPTDNGANLMVSKGRLYLDGLRIENESNVTYDKQADLPNVSLPDIDGVYLAYLEVRNRHVTALEDPEIRETALAGVDTASREQILWQVRLEKTGLLEDVTTFNSRSTGPAWETLNQRNPGRMAARSLPDSESDLCGVGERGGYSLPENKLYRVEIHQSGGPGTATYKWSRDNAILVSEWLEQNENQLIIRNAAKDDILRFSPGKWIEITDERLELKSLPGVLVPILRVEDDSITCNLEQTLYTPETLAELNITQDALPRLDINDFNQGRRKIRLWDMSGAIGPQSLPNEGDWAELEENIQIKFDGASEVPARHYKTGDYWQIPARVALQSIEWPCENDAPAACLPMGNQRHFVRLAFLKRENGVWESIADCRRIFPAQTDLTLEYAGGDGQECRPEEAVPLNQPLSVRVSRGQVPVPDVPVLFQIRDVPQSGDGGELIDLLIPTNKGYNLTALTDENGLARVSWRLAPDRDRINQTVKAILAGPQDETLMWLEFNANLSLASSVSYDPTNGGPDAVGLPAATSQEALDKLFVSKVNRAGDTITGSLTVDQDVEIKGNLIVSGDVTAKDEEHVKGSVELGDEPELDYVTVNAKMRGPRLSPPDFGPLLVEGDQFISNDLKIAGSLGVGYGEMESPPANALLSAGSLTITNDGLVGVSESSPDARLHISSPESSSFPPLRVEAREEGVGGRTLFIPVDVSNDITEDLLNFQIPLTVDTATPITNGHMRLDGGDIRFVDKDRTTPLLHWVESGMNSADTRIWVKVPLLPASASHRIYMYYDAPEITGGESSREIVLNGVLSEVRAAWNMEENTIQDVSGRGHNSDVRSSPTKVSGPVGRAYRFDGLDDGVVIPDNSDFNVDESFSMAGWFNCEGPGSGVQSDVQGYILAKRYTGSSHFFSLHVEHNQGKLLFEFWDPNHNLYLLTSTTGISYDTWYHVVAVFNKGTGTASIYLNGALDRTLVVGPVGILHGGLPVTIGCILNSNDGSSLRGFFKGALDEIRFYHSALSAVQAQALFESRSEFSPDFPGEELLVQYANPAPTLQIGAEENDTNIYEQTALFVQASPGYVGIGTAAPRERLSVNGVVESMSGGFRFPDGTVQSTAWDGSNQATSGNDMLPLGTILAWHKSFEGTPALPAGWVECNGQIVDDLASPYQGQTLPDLNNPRDSWNSKGSFLRGGTVSGEFEDDRFQGHWHDLNTNTFGASKSGGHEQASAFPHSRALVTTATTPISDGTNSQPRTGSETRPVNMVVVWIIKIIDNPLTGASGSEYWNKSGDDLFYNSGNVGVGTHAPQTNFEVEGHIHATPIMGTWYPSQPAGGGDNQSISVILDSEEHVSAPSYFTNLGGSNGIRIEKSGYYDVEAPVLSALDNGSTAHVYIRIDGEIKDENGFFNFHSSTLWKYLHCKWKGYIEAGAVIKLEVSQTRGSSHYYQSSARYTRLNIHRIA